MTVRKSKYMAVIIRNYLRLRSRYLWGLDLYFYRRFPGGWSLNCSLLWNFRYILFALRHPHWRTYA
jgi:hypothetical protein